jgi:hypothetical protein
MDDVDAQRNRERELPEFERDDERTVGGGLMSHGGTVTDRGTGDLDGTPQAADDDAGDLDAEGTNPDERDARERLIPAAGAGAGGAPYLAAAVPDQDDDEDDRRRDED